MADIFKFSEAASIGVHSMILIARNDKAYNAIELSKLLNKSKHHIGKVLQRLVKTGYLKSMRGPTGGFMLNVEPKDISMYSIYTAIEGPVKTQECNEHNSVCPFKKCIQNNVINKLSREFVEYMQNQNLQEYL